MATWKKVLVSGSNVSELVNDIGYLTAATFPSASNAFATASYNGVGLFADNPLANLTFASGSGTGLLMSASAGNDTLTFSLVAIPNASLLNSSISLGGQSISLGGSVAFPTFNLASSSAYPGDSSLIHLGTVLTGDVKAILPSGVLSGSLSSIMATEGANRILTSDGDGTITAEPNFTFDGATGTITGGLTVTGDLLVQGTASFQNTQNLEIADRFIRLASGSSSGGDGGIVVQQTGGTVGEAFAFDFATLRWGVTSSFDASQATIVPDAYVGMALVGAGTVPTSVNARYQAKGNVFVGTDEAIWIYS